ncbi:hypothetical protein O0L34_g19162 [Tuta absoluta]|nr:hypothetical protein O0L34_g19162 [Tuta absoluta]
MCCVEFFVKYILFFVNFAFWLGGVALITIGILVLTNVSEILDQLPVNLNGVPIAVIVAGSVIFVIAFSGCYGAITESRCWLVFYAVFMLITAAGKSYLAYVILSQISTIPQNAQKWINDAFNNNNIVNNNFQIFETTVSKKYIKATTGHWPPPIFGYAVFMLIIAAGKSYFILSQISTIPQNAQKWINDAFNNNNIVNNNFQIFETTFHCCGSTGANAYLNLGLPIPPTCCPAPENDTCSVEVSYGGCGTRFGEYLDSYAEAVGIVIIIIIVAEVFAMLAAFYMSHRITRRRQRIA